MPKYPLAGAYYDSAVSYLDKDYPDYEIVLNKKKSLSRLIADYNIIESEDSLQRMAKLNGGELDKLIKRMIKKAIEDEEKAKEDAENVAFNSANSNEINNGAAKNVGTGSSWYFYNQQQLTFGFSEFQKKWGARKLEDNWRRSNKQVIANFNPEESDTTKGKLTSDADTTGPTKSKTWYTKNLPLTKEKVDASTLKIVEAYYDLGLIYKEQLMDLTKAASTFETLNQKYPGNKYEATCYYQLYRLYLAMKDNVNADINKNLILSKYPNTDYAQILRNPQYNAEKSNRLNKIEAYYEETYLAYTDGNYAVALDRCNAADTLIAKSKFKPKFALLKSLCIGRLKPVSEFELALKQVVADYPKDSVKIRAEEILVVIHKLKFGDKAPAPLDSASAKATYKPGPDKTHFFVLAFDTKDVNTEQQSVAVSDFNTKYFESKNYKSNYMPFGKNKGLIVVRLFKNSAEALQYFTTTQADDDIFKNLETGNYSYFVISDENYSVLFKEQNTDKYVEFFAQNYKPE